MHLRLLRAAATVALLGGTATVGLGFTQAALAVPPPLVGCTTADLTTAISGATSGATLYLTPHCTYILTAELDIMKNLTIEGPATLVPYHSDHFSVIVVGCTDKTLTLDNVNITNGGGTAVEDGGAIDITESSDTVNVYGGTFSDNSATEYGGAIYNEGTLTVDGATFTDNGAPTGGAVYSENDGTTLDHDTFVGNDANEGGAIYNDDSDMQIAEGVFRYNSVSGDDAEGGAIYNEDDVTIDESQFGMNSALGENGEGAAIYNDDETVYLNHSLVTANHATEYGGAIYDEDSGADVYLAFDLINANTPDNCYPTALIDGCVG
jgi:predicted outer membrane repeat protein